MSAGIGDTVLLVEDDENDIFFMRNAFERAGVSATLHVAVNGQEAIEYLAGAGRFADRAEFPFPKLILLDLKLPLINGLEVLKWLRDQPALRTTPVIVISSSTQENDVAEVYERGGNAYLVKPTNPEQLRQVVGALDQFWLKLNCFAEAPLHAARVPRPRPQFDTLRRPLSVA